MGLINNIILFFKTLKELVFGGNGLSKQSMIVEGLIPIYGVGKVRNQVIKSIKDDCNRVIRKEPWRDTPEKIMESKMAQQALTNPDYMRMLQKVGLGEIHMKLLAKEALGEKNKPSMRGVRGVK